MEQIHHIVTKKLFYLLFVLLCFAGCEKDSEPLVYPPTLVTNEATNLTRFQATLSGSAIKNPKSVIDCEIEFLFSSSSSMSDPQIRPGQKESDSDRYTSTVDGLTPGITYYYCICAVSGKTLTKGSVGKFTTTASVAPIPGTTAVSEATEIGFTLTSSITDDGGYAPTTRGFVYKEFIEGVGVPTTDDHVILVPTWSEDFTVTLTTLQPNTTYLIRSYAINQTGTGYGESITVATDELKVPILTIGECSDIKAFSTNISATITDDRGLAITERGFCLSAENRKPTTENINVLVEGGNVSFSSVIDDLESQKKYYLRAYAINEKGTGYSPTIEFTTLTIQVASLSTPEINNITISTAKVNSVVTIPEGTTVTEKGICYDKLSLTPTTDEAHLVSTDESNAILADLKELEEGITYYVRAYAVTRDGTYYSSSVHFSTAQTYTPSLTAPVISTVKETSAAVTATVSDNGGDEVTTTGFCWSSSSQEPSLSDANSKYQVAGEGFKLDIGELKGGTKYYIRAYAKNKNGVAYSTTTEFTTTSTYAPTVTTVVVSDITETTAKAVAKVITNGGSEITEKGICWSSTSLEPTNDGDHLISNAEGNDITASLGNLTAGTKYYVRAYAINKKGTSYSSSSEFVSGQTYKPTVSAPVITNITEIAASVTSIISDNGGAEVTTTGFCWSSSSQEPSLSDANSRYKAASEGFKLDISELKGGTKYYIRAYAKNKNGVAYSTTTEFTTVQIYTPTVGMAVITNITKESVVAGATVKETGGTPIIEKGFCYSNSSQEPSIEKDTKVVSNAEGEAISATINGLEEGGKYYLRAYATNKKGTSYSSKVEFTTLTTYVPSLNNPTFTNISETGAAVSAQITDNGGTSITEKGICYSSSSTQPNISDDTKTTSSVEGNNIAVSLGSLTAGTKYYVRAYATNKRGTSYSATAELTTAQTFVPTLANVQVMDIKEVALSASSSVSNNGGAAVTEKGICYSSTSNQPTIDDTKILSTEAGNAIAAKLTGLTGGVHYYLRAYAINKNGIGYGNVSDVVTISFDKPTVDMPTFSEINDDNAKATAIISNHGGPDMEITEKGFVWAVGNTSPTIEGDHSIKSTDNEDTFNAVLTGLSYRTTYWVRAYAKNRLGISYSGAKSFTSGYSSTPSIGSVTALNIQIATVDVSASITSDGGATVTEKGFVWGTSSYPTIENNKLPVTTGGTDMTATLTGLKAGTTYYIRAYAKNKNGYSYGYSTTVAMKQGDPDIDDNVPPINKKTNQK